MNDGLGYKLVQTLDERPDFREGYLTELLDWYGERYPVIAEDLRGRIDNRTRPQKPTPQG